MLALLAFLISFAHASEPFIGPDVAAMGGAGVGSIDAIESQFMNPASLGLNRRQIMAVLHGSAGDMPNLPGYNGNAITAIDGDDQRIFPGALSYLRYDRTTAANQAIFSQEMQFALGYNLRPRTAIGLVTRYLMLEGRDAYNVKYYNFNAGLGFMTAPFSNWCFGLVASDILETNNSIPMVLRPLPTVSAGLSVAFLEIFRFRADAVSVRAYNPENLVDVRTGLEVYTREMISLRMGYAWVESRKVQELSGGIGLVGPRLSFAYSVTTTQKSYQVSSSTSVPDGQKHIFDFWLPF